jgi:hypothetical protein
MRTWLVSFSTLTALTAMAGAVASGCSSDNTPPANGDSGMDVTTPPPDTGTADHATADAPGEAAKEAAPPACVDAAVNTARLDAGAAWGCVQTLCDLEGGLNACGASCVCNDAVLAGLLCVIDSGQANATSCFTNALTPAAADPTVGAFVTCLSASATTCNPMGGDGGTDAGRDGGTEGGAEGGPDGGTDGGSDGAATDAAEGG